MKIILEEFIHKVITLVFFHIYAQVPVTTYFPQLFLKIFVGYIVGYSIKHKIWALAYSAAILGVSLYKSYQDFLVGVALFAVIVLQYHEKVNFTGKVSILRVVELGLWVLMWVCFITESLKTQVWFDLLAIEILHQSWVLCRELSNFAVDFKSKLITGAIILGRYDSYRVFTLLQIFLFSLVFIDALGLCLKRGAPLVLMPWTCHFIFKIRNMKMNHFSSIYFGFCLVFISLHLLTYLNC